MLSQVLAWIIVSVLFRYVWMLGSMLKGGLRMSPSPSFLLCVVLHGLPKMRPDEGEEHMCDLEVVVSFKYQQLVVIQALQMTSTVYFLFIWLRLSRCLWFNTCSKIKITLIWIPKYFLNILKCGHKWKKPNHVANLLHKHATSRYANTTNLWILVWLLTGSILEM